MSEQHRFSGPETVFHRAGASRKSNARRYAALIDAYRLTCAAAANAIGEHHRVRKESRMPTLNTPEAPSVDLEGYDYISEAISRLPL